MVDGIINHIGSMSALIMYHHDHVSYSNPEGIEYRENAVAAPIMPIICTYTTWKITSKRGC